MAGFGVRTDLALEEREKIQGDNREVDGVSLEEETIENEDIKISKMHIFSDEGAKVMGRPKGHYITIESAELVWTAEIVAEHIKELLENKEKIMIAGLGNREATPDALGPQTAAKIFIREGVFVTAPGVFAQTGIETAEYIKGLVREVEPDVLIVVDALAARNIERVNRTIQITDTGICPGSGVGNNRHEISEATMGVKVIAVGVPTVVDAATIIIDAFEYWEKEISEEKMDKFVKKLVDNGRSTMYVTPKDIDENIKILSDVVADSINMALE